MLLEQAKKIMGKNFIGPMEWEKISDSLPVTLPQRLPPIIFTPQLLKRSHRNYILILGVVKDKQGGALTLNRLRTLLGVNPHTKEPCFYNQDWYLKEAFAATTTLKNRWYLIRKEVVSKSRGINPERLMKKFPLTEHFPPAILTAVTFFAYYFLNQGARLWEHDFVWCADTDTNGDRIYTGRYEDSKGINKNGFNVHRHLSLRSWHGSIIEIVS